MYMERVAVACTLVCGWVGEVSLWVYGCLSRRTVSRVTTDHRDCALCHILGPSGNLVQTLLDHSVVYSSQHTHFWKRRS